MTTKNDIREWLNSRFRPENATHMIVVCDTFDYEDYPVFVKDDEDIQDKIKKYDRVNMQKIMEIYDLRIDIEEQLNQRVSWNI